MDLNGTASRASISSNSEASGRAPERMRACSRDFLGAAFLNCPGPRAMNKCLSYNCLNMKRWLVSEAVSDGL